LFESDQYSFYEVYDQLAENEVITVEQFSKTSVQDLNSFSDQNTLVHQLITFKKQATMSTILRRDGLFPSASLAPSFDLLVDDFFNRDLLGYNDRNFPAIGSRIPSANIEETPKSFKIELAAPGLRKEDFNVELKNNILTIASEKEESSEEKDEEGRIRRKEFNFSSFQRSFTLPETANEEKIEATYKDGILHLEVAKKHTDSPKSAKKIDIK
jgi:HSP20 family protein